MAVRMGDFHITDVIYDSEEHKLTYKFNLNGSMAERVGIGFVTDDDIIFDLQKILDEYFAEQ